MKTFPTALHPVVGQRKAFSGVGEIGCARRAFVERHHDVCADCALDVHHFLGREEMLASVDVGTKFASLLAQFSDACQRKYLKATAVCQHGAVESIELMEAACTLNDVQSWAQI